MQEQDAVKILGALIKVSSQQKRALQFHDIVLAEDKQVRLAKAAHKRQIKASTASFTHNDGLGQVGVESTQRPPPPPARKTNDLKPKATSSALGSNKPRLKV